MFAAAFFTGSVSCNRVRTNVDSNQQGLAAGDSSKITGGANAGTGESKQKKEPEWLSKLYDNDGQGSAPHAVAKVICRHKLTDTTSYALVEIAEVTCTVILLVITKNGLDFGNYEIDRSCMMDYAYYNYAGSEYVYDSLNNIITTLSLKETAKAKYLVKDKDGIRFKDGYSMENAEKEVDSIVNMLKIMPNGEVIKEKVSTEQWQAVRKQKDQI